jgi:hypothetical protein
MSSVTYSGNGSLTDFTVTFPYVDRDFVKVSISGAPQTLGSDYNFISATEVRFVVAPPAGVDNILIKRETSATPVVDFVNGSPIDADALDLAIQQSLHIVEEQELFVSGEDARLTALESQAAATDVEQATQDGRLTTLETDTAIVTDAQKGNQQIWDDLQLLENNFTNHTSAQALDEIRWDLAYNLSLNPTYGNGALNARVNDNDTELADHETRISTNEADIAALNPAAITALEGRVTVNEGDILSLTGLITTNQNNITSNDSDIAALDGRVTQNEADIAGLSAVDVVALQAEVDANTAAISTINSEQVTQDGRLDSVEATNTSQGTSISSLAAANIAQDTRLDSLEGLTGDVSTGNVALRTDVDAVTVTADANDIRLDTVEGTITSPTIGNTALDTRVADLETLSADRIAVSVLDYGVVPDDSTTAVAQANETALAAAIADALANNLVLEFPPEQTIWLWDTGITVELGLYYTSPNDPNNPLYIRGNGCTLRHVQWWNRTTPMLWLKSKHTLAEALGVAFNYRTIPGAVIEDLVFELDGHFTFAPNANGGVAIRVGDPSGDYGVYPHSNVTFHNIHIFRRAPAVGNYTTYNDPPVVVTNSKHMVFDHCHIIKGGIRFEAIGQPGLRGFCGDSWVNDCDLRGTTNEDGVFGSQNPTAQHSMLNGEVNSGRALTFYAKGDAATAATICAAIYVSECQIYNPMVLYRADESGQISNMLMTDNEFDVSVENVPTISMVIKNNVLDGPVEGSMKTVRFRGNTLSVPHAPWLYVDSGAANGTSGSTTERFIQQVVFHDNTCHLPGGFSAPTGTDPVLLKVVGDKVKGISVQGNGVDNLTGTWPALVDVSSDVPETFVFSSNYVETPIGTLTQGVLLGGEVEATKMVVSGNLLAPTIPVLSAVGERGGPERHRSLPGQPAAGERRYDLRVPRNGSGHHELRGTGHHDCPAGRYQVHGYLQGVADDQPQRLGSSGGGGGLPQG